MCLLCRLCGGDGDGHGEWDELGDDGADAVHMMAYASVWTALDKKDQ